MKPQGLTLYVVCGESTKINYICCTYNEPTRITFKYCIREESTMYGCIYKLKRINSTCCMSKKD